MHFKRKAGGRRPVRDEVGEIRTWPVQLGQSAAGRRVAQSSGAAPCSCRCGKSSESRERRQSALPLAACAALRVHVPSPCVPVRPRASRERDHVTRSGAGRARRRCRGRVVPSRSARDWLTAVCLSTSARRGVRVRAVVPQDVVVYTQERRQFGRPLVEFQAVQLKLAEMKTKVQGRRGGPAHAAGGACSQHARATPSTRLGAPPSPLPPGGCGAAAPGAGRQRGRRVG